MVVIGYRICGETNIQSIEYAIAKAQRSMKKIREREYHRLLGEELALVCDNIALGVLNRAEINDIFHYAVNLLNEKIRASELTGIASPYNLQAFLYVMNYENDTYFKVICQNDKLLAAFRHLEEYHLSEQECEDRQNAKTLTWKAIHDIYENAPVLSVNLSGEIVPDRTKLVFPSKEERCEKMARYSLTQHYLSLVSGGKQIPPFLLMPFVDVALDIIACDEGRREFKIRKAELARILPDIDKDSKFIFPDRKEDTDKEGGQPETAVEE